jgi:hypothetical protein
MEHRGEGRKHLFIYLDVLDRLSGKLLGHLGDISEGGLMIISEHPMNLNEMRYIRIKLPEEDAFNAKYLDVKVETRWQKPDVNPELFCIGCRFKHIDQDDLDIVEILGKYLSFEG